MSKPQPSFPSYNWTPKHFGFINTLHPNPRDEFRTCWGRVEELLVAEELWNDHKKLFFFPFSSAATCTNRPLEVNQRARRVSKGSNLAPMTASHRYTVNRGGHEMEVFEGHPEGWVLQSHWEVVPHDHVEEIEQLQEEAVQPQGQ
ncbi:hypothetical protein Taro_021292 [Colocasia esculenta]|uniref:Uncharacterized protein n=1 Tax=Colocasia esculenta TaxID=4460 RepID=A0A843UR04_COLES|nr:hypothetical protein [Colocasia esculenta]